VTVTPVSFRQPNDYVNQQDVMPKREAAAAWHAAQNIDVTGALQPLVPEITADGG
jgi:hypothetical protein